MKLSDKHGLNPAICCCYFCGEPKNQIILTGAKGDRWAKERERTPGLYDRDIDYIKSIPLSSFTPEDGVLLRMERMSLDVKKYPAKKGEYPLALKFTFNNGAYTYENTITYTFE